jgi:hypothetical protein
MLEYFFGLEELLLDEVLELFGVEELLLVLGVDDFEDDEDWF